MIHPHGSAYDCPCHLQSLMALSNPANPELATAWDTRQNFRPQTLADQAGWISPSSRFAPQMPLSPRARSGRNDASLSRTDAGMAQPTFHVKPTWPRRLRGSQRLDYSGRLGRAGHQHLVDPHIPEAVFTKYLLCVIDLLLSSLTLERNEPPAGADQRPDPWYELLHRRHGACTDGIEGVLAMELLGTGADHGDVLNLEPVGNVRQPYRSALHRFHEVHVEIGAHERDNHPREAGSRPDVREPTAARDELGNCR